MCGGQNKMFDALRWEKKKKKKAWAPARRICESCRKLVPVGVLKVNDDLNLYLQTGCAQRNNEAVYQADDLLLNDITAVRERDCFTSKKNLGVEHWVASNID